jgi:aromatic ring-opening dioxygenase catalytic subunit (LigB family)
MFGTEFDVPVVQVSIDSSLDPEKNWAIGKALSALRYVLSPSIIEVTDL